MSLKILGFIHWETWIRLPIIIIITLIPIRMFQTIFHLLLLTTTPLLLLRLILITTTLVTLSINKSFSRKPVTSPLKILEVAYRTSVNKSPSYLYSTTLHRVQQELTSLD